MGAELESSLLGQELRCSRRVVEGIPVMLALNLTLWLEEGNGMPLTERERLPRGVPPWHGTPHPCTGPGRLAPSPLPSAPGKAWRRLCV